MTRRPGIGWALMALGVAGVLAGLVPFATNGLRIVVREDLWNVPALARHGVEAMGLGVEWGMLSSAMGAYLGALMLWAGIGWLRRRPWARLATWVYVTCALTVNATDMVIFVFRAKPGAMRTQMLVFDGVALLIPVALGVGLLCGRRPAVEATVPAPSPCGGRRPT